MHMFASMAETCLPLLLCDAATGHCLSGTSLATYLAWGSPAAAHALQEAEVVALPRIIVKRWPGAGIDVLVNNAGLGRNNAALWDGSTASWVEMISTNVLGVCMCTREVLKVKAHPASLQPCPPEHFMCSRLFSERSSCACARRRLRQSQFWWSQCLRGPTLHLASMSRVSEKSKVGSAMC